MIPEAAPPEGDTTTDDTATSGDATATADTQTGTQLDDITALQRELDKTRKEAASYRTKLKDAEQANLSESERLAARLADLESNLAERETEALRLRVANRHKISDDDAAMFLTGSTESELETQAARLAEINAAAQRNGMVVSGEGRQPSAPPGAPLQEVARKLFSNDQ